MTIEAVPKVVFISKEGVKFDVSFEVARLVGLTKELLDDPVGEETTIEIPMANVSTAILESVIAFCEHYVKEPMTTIEQPLKSHVMSEVVEQYYADFVTVDEERLKDLIMAGNFMHIDPLLELTGAAVAALLLGLSPEEKLSPEEIRTTFEMGEDNVEPAQETPTAASGNENAALEQ